MFSITLPSRIQPRSCVSVTDGALGKGVIVAVSGSLANGGLNIWNAALNHTLPTLIGGSNNTSVTAAVATPYGTAMQIHPAGGASGFPPVAWPNALLGASSNFSAIWFGSISAANANNASFLSRGQANDGVRFHLTSETNLRFSYIDSSPAQFNLDLTIPTVSFNDGAYYKFGLTRRGNERFIFDGNSGVVSAAQSTGLISMRDDSPNYGVGIAGNSGANGHIRTIAAIWWARGLTDAEMFDVLENPWAIYSSSRRIYLPAPAGGATERSATDGMYLYDQMRKEELHQRLEGFFLRDQGLRDIAHTEHDKMYLLDQVLAQALRQPYALDSIFVRDDRYSDHGKLRQDGIYLNDSRTSARESTLRDGLYLKDYTVKELLKIISDGLLLLDQVITSAQNVYNVTASDGLYLKDYFVREILKLIKDAMLLHDTAQTEVQFGQGVFEVTATDYLLIGDVTVK
ncbi:MAG: hypothetical protein ACREQF_01590, partial [Candidatus Binataceae bacterium]